MMKGSPSLSMLRQVIGTTITQRASMCASDYMTRSIVMEAAASDGPSSIRSKRRRERSEIDITEMDLVGPPDPISNIRPMFYAPVRSSSSPSSSKASSSSVSKSAGELPHPYSLSEFSQLDTPRSKGDQNRGLGRLKSYRDLVDRVSQRVEESELRLRVEKMSTDNVTQRFWRDNNLRFNRDLDSWREESHKRIHTPPDGVKNLSSLASVSKAAATKDPSRAVIKGAEDSVDEMSVDESVFYANWLRANAKRNRLYNVLVWKQAWNQVRMGAQVTLLRQWLKLLQRL